MENNTKYKNINYKYQSDKKEQPTTTKFIKRKCSLCKKTEAGKKTSTCSKYKLCGRSHEKFIQLRKRIEDKIGLQFGSAGNVINLSTKAFNRDAFNFLKKNLNFLLMKKAFQQNETF